MARKAKSKRKNKQKKRMPPLSLLDQTIYIILILLSIVLDIGILLLMFFLRNRVAFSVPGVLAAGERASLLWSVIPAIVLFLIAFIRVEYLYTDRRPIFGKRGIKYGPPQYPAVYPIFMKDKPPVWVSEAQKRNRRFGAVALLILIVVSILPFPLSLYGRDSLQADGSIVEYSMFGWETERHEREDIVEVEFSLLEDNSFRTYNRSWIRYLCNLKPETYTVCVTITTDDGERFVFRSGDFQAWGKGERTSWLVDMLHLKALFPPEIVTYADTDKLSYAASDYDLSEQETERLYALFSTDAS